MPVDKLISSQLFTESRKPILQLPTSPSGTGIILTAAVPPRHSSHTLAHNILDTRLDCVARLGDAGLMIDQDPSRTPARHNLNATALSMRREKHTCPTSCHPELWHGPNVQTAWSFQHAGLLRLGQVLASHESGRLIACVDLPRKAEPRQEAPTGQQVVSSTLASKFASMIFPSPSSPEATDVPYQLSQYSRQSLGQELVSEGPTIASAEAQHLCLPRRVGELCSVPACLLAYYRPSCLSFLTVVWEVVSLSRVQGLVAYSDIYVTCYSLMGIATIDFIPVTLLFVLISRASAPPPQLRDD
ncbi:hypothetical protein AUP68_13204 [Ilyonectria robusta]